MMLRRRNTPDCTKPFTVLKPVLAPPEHLFIARRALEHTTRPSQMLGAHNTQSKSIIPCTTPQQHQEFSWKSIHKYPSYPADRRTSVTHPSTCRQVKQQRGKQVETESSLGLLSAANESQRASCILGFTEDSGCAFTRGQTKSCDAPIRITFRAQKESAHSRAAESSAAAAPGSGRSFLLLFLPLEAGSEL